jgi:hypothetical protein
MAGPEVKAERAGPGADRQGCGRAGGGRAGRVMMACLSPGVSSQARDALPVRPAEAVGAAGDQGAGRGGQDRDDQRPGQVRSVVNGPAGAGARAGARPAGAGRPGQPKP